MLFTQTELGKYVGCYINEEQIKKIDTQFIPYHR